MGPEKRGTRCAAGLRARGGASALGRRGGGHGALLAVFVHWCVQLHGGGNGEQGGPNSHAWGLFKLS